jgi:hypothetical protein
MTAFGGRSSCGPAGRQAFTLTETLFALSIAALVLAGVGGSMRAVSRAGTTVQTDAAELQTRALAAHLLRGEVERAGRGGADRGGHLAVVLDPFGRGRDRLEVGYLAEEDRAEPTLLTASFYAARDGEGRPNLYRRPPGSVRQPWLLGVTGVHVVSARSPDGRRIERHGLQPGTPIAAIEVRVDVDRAEGATFWASTRRAGSLGAVRWNADAF